jgi:hydrogenase nickel incorporation protein HypB
VTVKVLSIKENILGANEEKAKAIQDLLARRGTVMINILASPGAGKTSLILSTIHRLKDKLRVGVIEGDIASTVDADKVAQEGVPVVQINTGGTCHLEAHMIDKALASLPLENIDVIFVENVGNLVCTAEFVLGEDQKVMLLSVPEGDDKPLKYPLMFSEANLVLVTKSDVMPHFDFDLERFKKNVDSLNAKAPIYSLSARTGEGLEPWLEWLQAQVKQKKASKS